MIMENQNNINLHIDERLERQAVNDTFAERRALASASEEEQSEVTNRLIGELVMETTFIAPVKIVLNPDGSTQFTFPMLKSADELSYFPMFTSSEDLEKWDGGKGSRTVQIGFEYFAQMLEFNHEVSGIVINPFSDNLRVERDLVDAWYRQKQLITQGHARHVITNDTECEFYPADPFPSELSEKLISSAKGIPAVKSIWILGAKIEGTEGYVAIADVEGDENVLAQSLKQLGESCRGSLDKPIHLVPYASDLGKDAVKDVIPIYSK